MSFNCARSVVPSERFRRSGDVSSREEKLLRNRRDFPRLLVRSKEVCKQPSCGFASASEFGVRIAGGVADHSVKNRPRCCLESEFYLMENRWLPLLVSALRTGSSTKSGGQDKCERETCIGRHALVGRASALAGGATVIEIEFTRSSKVHSILVSQPKRRAAASVSMLPSGIMPPYSAILAALPTAHNDTYVRSPVADTAFSSTICKN